MNFGTYFTMLGIVSLCSAFMAAATDAESRTIAALTVLGLVFLPLGLAVLAA